MYINIISSGIITIISMRLAGSQGTYKAPFSSNTPLLSQPAAVDGWL